MTKKGQYTKQSVVKVKRSDCVTFMCMYSVWWAEAELKGEHKMKGNGQFCFVAKLVAI